MEEKVSLVKEKINDSIVRLFSYLPYGGFYTDSKFDEETRELVVTGEHTPRRLEDKPIRYDVVPFIIGTFTTILIDSLKENEYVINAPEPIIDGKLSIDGTTDITVKCRIKIMDKVKLAYLQLQEVKKTRPSYIAYSNGKIYASFSTEDQVQIFENKLKKCILNR